VRQRVEKSRARRLGKVRMDGERGNLIGRVCGKPQRDAGDGFGGAVAEEGERPLGLGEHARP
jgi:hypothetical protein